MIQASDLRTGNILKYFIGEEGLDWQETTIDAQDILWCQQNNDSFNKVHKPVELSDSILLVCGFEDMHGEYCPSYRKDHIEIEITETFMARLRYDWNEYGTSLLLSKPKYLHELQNLIFALTGKELTYNPSK